MEYALWAIKAGVKIRSVQDPEMFPEGEMALLLAAVGGMRNHQDSKRKAAAVKDGMKRRAERGKLSGGIRPYGYRWEGPKLEKRLAVVLSEAKVVRRMFEDTLSGVSQRALARRLNDEHVPTVTGRPWGQATVSRILANPIYKGRIRHGGEIFDGEHKAIVTNEIWEQVRTVRESQARKPGGRWPKGSHLLTKGLLRCGKCGYAMTPRTDPGRETYEVYECHGRRTRGPDFCDQPAIRRHVVDEPLLDELLSGYVDLDETCKRIEERRHADVARARDTLADADRMAARALEARTGAKRDYIEDKLPAEKWSPLDTDRACRARRRKGLRAP